MAISGLVSRRVADRWDSNFSNTPPSRQHWWHSKLCQEYYNYFICGSLVDDNGGGCREYLSRKLMGEALPRAISVGCGSGSKEISLIEAGLVDHFDLWEVSEKAGEQGRRDAEKRGIGDRITYHIGNDFKTARDPYDLVYWDHSLHHMSDVTDAIRWSARIVRPGGYVMINDYIGPNRLHFPDDQVKAANDLLSRHGVATRIRLSSALSYYKQMIKDPSEAPQSERILSAIVLNMPNVELRLIGGALLNILSWTVVRNFADDHPLMFDMLEQDTILRKQGTSHFVFAFWRRPDL